MESLSGADREDGSPEEQAGDYCRRVEAYLCRKNDGHLIRIAGPSFTRVGDWAARGIPLAVVYRGIDRYFERYYSRGPRRRPVQIDFCENDVLDVFDEWRRAVGVWTLNPGTPVRDAGDPAPGSTSQDGSPATAEAVRSATRRASLPAHLERVIVRLTTLRAGARFTPEADAMVDAAVRELDGARGGAAHLRGAAREALVARLKALDRSLIEAVRGSLAADEWQALEREARDELEPFRSGMADEAYRRAVDRSASRLLRERFRLPVIEYEE